MSNALSTSLSKVVSPLIKAAGETTSLFLAFSDDVTIEFKTNSEALRTELESYFAQFLTKNRTSQIEVLAIETAAPQLDFEWTIKQPDPGKSKIKEEFVDFTDGRIVRKRLTGLVLAMSSDMNLAIGPCKSNSNQVINFINNRFIEWQLQRGGVLGHAAGVEKDGRGIAIAGFSGMGKSTLALQLMNQDCRFVSNDRLVLRKSGEDIVMLGIAKHPRVNPGTVLNNEELSEVIPDEERRKLATLSSDELWKLEQKYDVIIDEVYGDDKFLLETRLNAVILLNWSREVSGLTVKKVDVTKRRDLLPAIMKQPGLFYRPTSGLKDHYNEEDYLEYLSNIAGFELSGGVNFSAATKICLEILAGDSSLAK